MIFFVGCIVRINVTLVVHRQPSIHQNHTRASHVRALCMCACNIVQLYNIIQYIILCAMRTSNSFAANRVPGAFIKMCNTLRNGGASESGGYAPTLWHTHTRTHVHVMKKIILVRQIFISAAKRRWKRTKGLVNEYEIWNIIGFPDDWWLRKIYQFGVKILYVG